MSESKPLSFEDKIDELDELLVKNKGKWQLDALAWIDYDDICQIIRKHIHEKWHLWDQSRPFRPWANTTIGNQIKNQVRNHYTNYAKPCIRCPHNMGGDYCFRTKSEIQDESCPDFAKWAKKKKRAYDVKMPVSLEDAVPKRQNTFLDTFCYDSSSKKLHELVMKKLSNDRQRRIYFLLYVEEQPEEVVAKEMGFKADTSKRKKVRYKQISNLQKRFKDIAKKVMEEEDIFY